MRSAIIVIAVGVALLMVAVASGVAWSGRHAPEWLRSSIETSISESLEARVRLPSLRLGLRGGLRLVALEASYGPSPAGLEARAERLTAWLDPLALVLGRVRLDRLEADGAVVSVRGTGSSGARGLSDWLAGLDAMRSAAVREIEIRSARLEEISADGSRVAILTGLEGTSQRGRLFPLLELSLAGVLPDAGSVGLELRFSQEDLDVELELAGIDLARIASPLRRLLPASSPVGRISGKARLERRGQRHTIDLDLDGEGIAGRIPGARPGPQGAFTLGQPRLDANLVLDPDGLEVVRATLRDGELPLHVTGRVGLPWVPSAVFQMRLAFDLLSADDVRGLIRRLPTPVPGAGRVLERLESCAIEGLALELDSSRAGVEELLARDLLARPGELRVTGTVREASVLIHGEGQPQRSLHDLHGTLRYDGEQLAIEDLRAGLDDRDLPTLDLNVGGLSNLRSLDEIRCLVPERDPGAQAVDRLIHWLGSFRKKEEEREGPPSWQRLAIEADWVAHPALLCQAQQLSGGLGPIPGGLGFAIERAIWAGMSLSGSGEIRLDEDGETPRRRIRLELELGSVFEGQDLAPRSEPWGQGRFHWDTRRIGPWHLRSIDGRFRLSGPTLHLEQAVLTLDPGGELQGSGQVDLARADALSLGVELSGQDLDLSQFVASFGAEDPERVSGRLSGSVRFQGPLLDGRSPLETATGELSMNVADGWLAARLPVLGALLLAEDPFEPIRGMDRIRFDSFDLFGQLADGVLDSPEFQMEGPSMRFAGAGRIGVSPPFQTDAVLGLLLFPQIDSLIGRLPVIKRVILGAHGNLIGAYYAIQGPWQKPRARLVPIKSLVSSGPASFMLEDIPSFLWGGLKRVHGVLLQEPKRRRAPGRAAPPPSATNSPPGQSGTEPQSEIELQSGTELHSEAGTEVRARP